MYLLLTVVVAGLFARLGWWQMSRAQEKITMQGAADAQALQPAITELAEFDQSMLYRKVKLQGRYDFDRQFLQDNRIHKQRVGYEVLTPFYPDHDKSRVILVNRGWIPQGKDRSSLPDISTGIAEPASRLASGLLVQPSKGFTLGDASDETQKSWPIVLQYIDYETIAAKLDKIGVLPAVLVLAPQEPQSYTYVWQPVANGPEKHYGYAFQWFAMMLAVIVLFVYLNFLKKK